MAEPTKTQDETQGKSAGSEPPPPTDQTSTTHHSVDVGGASLAYTATAGTYVLKKEDGTPRASLFYVAYIKEGGDGGRPVTFCFNGGPGSSSVWLHMGAFGPRRVEMTSEGFEVRPPGRLRDNEHTLLASTDLVFIDPVTTGFSRATKEDTAKEFHGVKPDVEIVGDFIRLWTTRNKRWASPKLLAGESYGTTRAAALAGYLQGRHAMAINGLLLISSVLNFQTVMFDAGNDLPFLLFLPTYTAIAHYHGKLCERLQKAPLRDVLDEAEAFALGDYALALLQGDRLPADKQASIARRLAELTGLTPEYVKRTRLRIHIMRFTQELLREEGRSVGRLDGRYRGFEADAAGESMTYDPSLSAITGPYSACLNHYLRHELGFESDLPYEILTSRVRPWDYGESANKYLDVAETLREAIAHNPFLKVFVANGYHDMATPYFATEYTFSHLGLAEAQRDCFTMAYYPAGHMMYVQEASLAQLNADLAAFIASAT